MKGEQKMPQEQLQHCKVVKVAVLTKLILILTLTREIPIAHSSNLLDNMLIFDVGYPLH